MSKRFRLVNKTRNALINAWPDIYHRVRPREPGCINLAVAPESVERALRIWSELIKKLKARGFSLVVGEKRGPRGSGRGGTLVVINGEQIEVWMVEVCQRVLHHIFSHCVGHQPTRRLFLVTGYWTTENSDGFRRVSRGDTAVIRLEDKLDDFISILVAASSEVRKDRLDRQESERRWKKERLAEEKRKRLQEEEERRIDDLFDRFEGWKKRQRLLRFLDAMEKEARPDGVVTNEWLDWARSYVKSSSLERED